MHVYNCIDDRTFKHLIEFAVDLLTMKIVGLHMYEKFL